VPLDKRIRPKRPLDNSLFSSPSSPKPTPGKTLTCPVYIFQTLAQLFTLQTPLSRSRRRQPAKKKPPPSTLAVTGAMPPTTGSVADLLPGILHQFRAAPRRPRPCGFRSTWRRGTLPPKCSKLNLCNQDLQRKQPTSSALFSVCYVFMNHMFCKLYAI
jgi:hypothetical protein